jgi:single-stranded-DNA-specific exonuclease
MGSKVFEELLAVRGLTDPMLRQTFLSPIYEASHDPYLLPDMQVAVDRIIQARENDEQLFIYGDYDIDGLTATTILLDALTAFGLKVKTFIPNRFVDGYGLSEQAIRQLHKAGASLLITVDCGSLSHTEITLANQLGMEVIVTDHHNVAETMPPAVATINPKRPDHQYPFIDLAGCGVAFKLVQALQQKLPGLSVGQEKWLLDLVALGTICDVVTLLDENRTFVYWGLKVLAKTKRLGLQALVKVVGIDLQRLDTRSVGYVIGPHLNAAGRLETAQLSLDLLTTTDPAEAVAIAYELRDMNQARRKEQDRIFKAALQEAETLDDHPVLVVSDPSWSHGIIGIVAAKLLERFHKPTFVLQELGEESKGSARSFGDFSAADGIRASEEWIMKGGGHKLAAGVTLRTEQIPQFRKAINEFYHSLQLTDQLRHLEPIAEVTLADLRLADAALIAEISRLEPFGNGNPEPVFYAQNLTVLDRREMGSDKQHLKLRLTDDLHPSFAVIGFNQTVNVQAQLGDKVDVWFQLTQNEWRGTKTIEGKMLQIKPAST